MTKTKQLNELFEEWEEKGDFEIFCRDGIVDEMNYDNQEIKVLYILKDLHLDEECKGFLHQINCHCIDIRKEGLEDGVGRTWNPLALWAKAWTDAKPQRYEDIEEGISNKEELRKKYIPRVAFLNIKKEAGEASVADETIEVYLKDEQNVAFLKREIKLCSPDVIIVCGVNLYDGFVKAIDAEKGKELCELSEKRKLYYLKNASKEIPVIQFRHPSRSGAYDKTYTDMLKIREFVLGSRK